MGDEAATEKNSKGQKGYDYLLGMAIWSLTLERVEELKKQNQIKTQELNNLQKMTIEELWTRDLDAVEAELDAIDEWEEACRKDEEKLKSGKRPKPMAARKRGAARPARGARGGKEDAGEEDEEEEEDADDAPPPPPPKKAKVEESNSDFMARLKERQNARKKAAATDVSLDLDDAPLEKKAKQE